ncbi:MAG: 2-isopropylmalate synthase [Alphaproteobacteria bacterium]|nr:2-isopropylmalate synthase [Alphaproteobacteria bacterium]MDA7985031.1 2-isopropylmalate synthase [Alphaproteobacteria bacterium]MDA7987849.1 2-isopropylmalate synthase [Alphaproteobacteria bacterium]MDA7989033.1 2-isopropylmalate synthase [Alphaproteobacteria bacterium]MDA8000356.1 2-isopropylmalate synthase [Alphaproteobacteria bacterium]
MTNSQNKVLIFDTSLRDGEQAPGCSMNHEEKLQIARVLAELGVDIIEAGFPIASPGDFEAVQTVSREVRDVTVAALARATRDDINKAAEALKPAARPRIHTFISTSPQHLNHILKMDQDQVIEAITDSVSHARGLCDDVQWSAQDASRTDTDFLCKAVETAITAGAATVNMPDTVGYAVPEEFADLIREIKNRVPNIDKARISVHCHNDLGLAVANSLAAVVAGARQVECTINGIGERAGNCSLEEVVMAIRTRNGYFNLRSDINTTAIMKASRLVSAVSGFVVQPNKAVVGKNAFAHESGIHQDGMLKNAETYEIMTPESVGLHESQIVLGKHSGRHALSKKLQELGIEVGDNKLNDLFARFKELADKKREIYDDDLYALADDTILRRNDTVQFRALSVNCGTEGPQSARVKLEVDGEVREENAEGNGPVDAIFCAIRKIAPPHPEAKLQLYQVHAVTGGTDAQAEVTVRLEEHGRSANGQGADHDTLVASARAYINALNKLLLKRERSSPDADAARDGERPVGI